MRVLVTGAAGTVGSQVVAELLGQGPAVEVVTFEQDSPAARKRLSRFAGRVSCHYGDLADPGAIARACAGVDAAVHLAAIIPPLADHQPELARRVNVDGTANLIAALESSAPAAFLLYASSISVYGDRLANPDIRVSDPLTPSEGDAYASTKIAAEALVQASALDWSIFRLTAIMGGHTVSPLMFHMPTDTLMEIATAADAGRAFARAVGRRDALAGRVFNLGGGPVCRIRYGDFLDRAFATIGLGRADFPEGAFATRNFHCGAYADGEELEAILQFRRDTIDDVFAQMSTGLPGWKKRMARLLRQPIKAHLLRQSEPWRAWRGKGPGYRRFFGPDTEKGAP